MIKHQASPVWVVIPAAGVGKRMRLDHPKQYIKIHNKTLIEHTLDCFLTHEQIAGVVVVLNPSDPYWSSLEVNSFSKPIHTVDGGENRSDSVRKGLSFLKEVEIIDPDTWIMVHDAARPYLQKSDIDSLLKLCDTKSIGGLLASPVRDTIKRSVKRLNDGNKQSVLTTVSRENLWHALTPQMFRLGKLLNALQYCDDKNLKVTDESSAMESIGQQPDLIEGSHNNVKVTHPSDIELVSFLLERKFDNKEKCDED